MPMNFETLGLILVVGLASYRVTMALVYDFGPFDLFESFRDIMGVHDIGQDGRPELTMGKILGCASCLGFWVALIISLFAFNDTFMILWVFLAAAGLQHFLSQRYLL